MTLTLRKTEVRVSHKIWEYTFCLEHNPNCPKPYLVRLPGATGFIDKKPVWSFDPSVELTGDCYAYGHTLEEAADAAIEVSEQCQRAFIEELQRKLKAHKKAKEHKNA